MKKVEKRTQSFYDISITLPDNKKIVKTGLSLYKLFDTYFINLDKNLSNKHYDISEAEEIYNKYQELFKKCKVIIQYVDSWDHRWKGSCAWPRKDKFIDYLKEKILNYSND